jgi:galactonate dehydratase
VHFASAVANFAWLETRASPGELYHGFDNPEYFPGMLTLEGAVYRVPDRPGLGVDVNEEAIQRESFKFWEAPHLHRKDGSVTNW